MSKHYVALSRAAFRGQQSGSVYLVCFARLWHYRGYSCLVRRAALIAVSGRAGYAPAASNKGFVEVLIRRAGPHSSLSAAEQDMYRLLVEELKSEGTLSSEFSSLFSDMCASGLGSGNLPEERCAVQPVCSAWLQPQALLAQV